MSFAAAPLPFAPDALAAKGISAEAIDFHYNKHHKGYATKLNGMVTNNAALAGKSLEDLIMTEKGGVFNCAAQIMNHDLFWVSLSPNGGGPATGPIADLINAKWGSFDAFKEAFTAAAAGHFGSGWVFLVKKDGGVDIAQGHDASCPITEGAKVLLACDVWEHAYYIDYRNDRPSYIKAWWGMVNWEGANARL